MQKEKMKGAVLLLHGLAGTPFEIRPLQKPLEDLGFYVENPALPGHDSSIEEFKKTRYEDWKTFAFARVKALCKEYDKVFVAGFSMGGCIAQEIAATFPLAGFITISAPHYVYRMYPLQVLDWRLPFLGILQYVQPYPKFRIASSASKAISPFKGYEGYLWLPQLYSMMQAYKRMRKNAHKITCPALIIHDLHDKIVLPSNALAIAESIKSADVTLYYTNAKERITSHHHIVIHQETKELVQGLVQNFLARLF